ncbi:glpK, partial [Symbiodinium microadriaticum]
IIPSIADCEQIASQAEDNGGVYFVPAFSGLYAPHWREDARGTIVGLTAYNNKSHIVRAALEGTAFQIRE